MNNEPVAWIPKGMTLAKPKDLTDCIPLYTQDQLEEARKLGMQQERALWNLSASTQEIMDTHPVKELTDEEIGDFTHRMVLCCGVHPNSADINVLGLKFIVEEILRKAQEK